MVTDYKGASHNYILLSAEEINLKSRHVNDSDAYSLTTLVNLTQHTAKL